MAQITLNVGSNANDGTGDTLRSAMQNVNTMFTELYASPLFSGDITVSGNNISANRSNDDLVLAPSGTGSVTAPKIVVDENITITDNEITTSVSNSDLVLSASGTGAVKIDNADVNGGNIDGTVIGASSAAAATFTTLGVNDSLTVDGVTITDNTISTNASNANLELTGNGTGGVTVSGFTFPSSDGSSGQFITTNGLGVLSFATGSATLSHSDIADATTTVASSSTSTLNTFDKTVYRSCKYFISATDATNSRYEFVEANVIHDGTTAYISTYGSVSDYTSGLATYSVDISGDDVRLRATNITNDSTVFKFQRIAIDI